MVYDIGIFDSGLGGLTVYQQLKYKFPDKKFAYLADSKRCPYGIKSKDSIQAICKSNVEFLLDLGVKVIVIACHTASLAAYVFLKNHFNVPMIPMHFLTGEAIRKIPQKESLLILGTQATVQNGYYHNLLTYEESNRIVKSVGCPLLVEYIQNQIDDIEMLEEIFNHYHIGKEHFDHVLLACTHFPILKTAIEKRFSTATAIIDPAIFIAKELELYAQPSQKTPIQDDFFVFGPTQQFDSFASKLINNKIQSTSVLLDETAKI
jgi:glutamate racemase